MSNTPLTDKLVFVMDGHEFCAAEHARKMEHDRARLIERLKNAAHALGNAGRDWEAGCAYAILDELNNEEPK